MGGDNFNKTNSDSESLLNALNNAKNLRSSTDTRLRKELQAQLEVKVSEYVNNLNLEKKISDAAVKGKKRITISLNAHLQETHFSEICIEKSDKNTNLTFSKTWDDYYLSMKDLLSADSINITLRRETNPQSPKKIRPLDKSGQKWASEVTKAHTFVKENLAIQQIVPNNTCRKARKNHTMSIRTNYTYGYWCSNCKRKMARGIQFMRCVECDYDLCDKCFVDPPDFKMKEVCKHTVGNYICGLEKNHMVHHPSFPNYGKLIIKWD